MTLCEVMDIAMKHKKVKEKEKPRKTSRPSSGVSREAPMSLGRVLRSHAGGHPGKGQLEENRMFVE